jgi:hypothetical protein
MKTRIYFAIFVASTFIAALITFVATIATITAAM